MAISGKQRPVFFNPAQIQMPVGALASILHRASGVLLALGLPFGAYLFELSLRNAQTFARLSLLVGSGLFKIAVIVFVWALAHHLMAGVRHLLSDIDVGSGLHEARRSAWFVNVGALAVTVLAVAVIL